MKTTNLRQDSLNTMTLEIDGRKFRIHGEAEISLHEARQSIPSALKAGTLEEIRANLGHLERTLKAVEPATPYNPFGHLSARGGSMELPGGIYIADVVNTDMFIAEVRGNTATEATARATYLVRAVNAHAELVAALLEYRRLYEAVQPTGGWQGVYELGNAALARATQP